MSSDDEVLNLFLEEALEYLDGIETDLLLIEKMGAAIDVDIVNKVFRAIHTIKGGSGFFALDKIKGLTHVAENILSQIRKQEMVPTQHIIGVLLEAVDLLNILLRNPGNTAGVDIQPTLDKLNGVTDADEVEEESSAIDLNLQAIFNFDEDKLKQAVDEDKGGEYYYLVKYNIAQDLEAQDRSAEDVMQDISEICSIIECENFVDEESTNGHPELVGYFCLVIATMIDPELAKSFMGVAENQVINFTLDEYKKGPTQKVIAKEVVSQVMQEEIPFVAGDLEKKSVKKEGNIRVSTKLLDQMMILAGELVLARNQLNQATENEDVLSVRTIAQDVDIITTQLQEAIMKTRMQSIGIVFNKFNRIVRDLSSTLGKQVKLHIEGDTIELDKTLIEAIGDPLVHIVRNSLDHGLEGPAERLANGKGEQGTLSIKAFHEAGKVVILIQDDGRGINPERIAEKAMSNGIISENELSSMSDKNIINLIFKPGFSTAEEVTDISGRGVGMDVVQSCLIGLGGTVDLSSQVNAGTQLKITLPLTLAIIPSLLVRIADANFALPQISILQLLRIPKSEIANKIRLIADSVVTRFMGEYIPVIRGEEFLDEDVKPLDLDSPSFGFNDTLSIAVVQSNKLKYGIVIDYPLDSQEIVVKPLGKHLKGLKIYAGATILGNGDVAPILDVTGIATECGINVIATDQSEEDKEVYNDTEDRHNLLILSNKGEEFLALPLQQIRRIEKVKHSQIENVGKLRTCKYRDRSLTLFRVDDVTSVFPLQEALQYTIAVFEVGGEEHGLLVNEIVDNVEISVHFNEFPYKQPGILGSSRVQDRLTLLGDLYEIVEIMMPEWVDKHKNTGDDSSSCKVLVVDDSRFFVKQISEFLEEAGYETLTAENGEEALAVLAENDSVDVVVTDIEMPVMDGWELTRRIRGSETLKDIPIVALTVMAGSETEEKGKALGINEYLIKLDKEKTLEVMKKYQKQVVG